MLVIDSCIREGVKSRSGPFFSRSSALVSGLFAAYFPLVFPLFSPCFLLLFALFWVRARHLAGVGIAPELPKSEPDPPPGGAGREGAYSPLREFTRASVWEGVAI